VRPLWSVLKTGAFGSGSSGRICRSKETVRGNRSRVLFDFSVFVSFISRRWYEPRTVAVPRSRSRSPQLVHPCRHVTFRFVTTPRLLHHHCARWFDIRSTSRSRFFHPRDFPAAG